MLGHLEVIDDPVHAQGNRLGALEPVAHARGRLGELAAVHNQWNQRLIVRACWRLGCRFVGRPHPFPIRLSWQLAHVFVRILNAPLLVRYETGETQRVAVEPGRERIGDRVSVGIRPEHPHAPAGHGFAARTTTIESLGDAAYPYAESPVAPDGLIVRSTPLERHDRGEALTLGASPDHCHLFGKEGRAFERRIAEVLSVA